MITYKIYSNIGNREVNEDSVGEQQKTKIICLYWRMVWVDMDMENVHRIWL